MVHDPGITDRSELSRFKSILGITIPFRKSCNSSRKGIRDDSISTTDNRGYATCRLFGKNAGSLRRCGPPIVRTLQLQPIPTDRGTTAAVFPVPGQRAKVSRPTATIALCGIKFFYERTLQRDWTALGLIRPRPEKKLPVVLSREEVHRILEQVHTPVYSVCLKTIYSCGLRLLEGAQLQVPDINSGRMVLHIHGKGGKDRYAPLPDRTLELLRELWKTHRSKPWVLPATTRGLKPGAPIHPLTDSSLQKAFKRPLERAGISKTRSYSFAPALLRHASAGNGREPPHHSGESRAPQRPYNSDLHASNKGSARCGDPSAQ